MDLIERDITLTCVSNSVGGKYVGGARWLGVRLTDLLDLAGVGSERRPDLQHRRRRHDDQHAAGAGHRRPRRDARRRHERRGAAARARLPGAGRGPRSLRLHQRHQVGHPAHADDVRGQAGVLDRAGLGHRRPDQDLQPDRHPQAARRRSTQGENIIGGVAWAQQNGGVAKVQVRIDGGAWQDAELGPSAGNDYWRQWFYRWDAPESGQHTLACPGRRRRRQRAGRPRAPTRSPRAPAASRSSSSRRLSRCRLTNPSPRAAPNTRHAAPTPLHHPTGRLISMKRTTLRRTGAAAAVLALSISLAACGDDSDEPTSGSDDTTSESSAPPTTWPTSAAADRRRRRDLRRRLLGDPDLRQGLVRRHGRPTRSPPPRATTRC